MKVIWVWREEKYFLMGDWTTQITLESLGKSSSKRIRIPVDAFASPESRSDANACNGYFDRRILSSCCVHQRSTEPVEQFCSASLKSRRA
jgi:hypothetical protein